MKKSDELTDKIVTLVRETNPTKKAICKYAGITAQTLITWLKTDEEFKRKYDEAVDDYLNDINIEAKTSLRKLISGYYYEETKTVLVGGGGPDGSEEMIKEKHVMKKYVAPSASMIEYALSNLDPKNFD